MNSFNKKKNIAMAFIVVATLAMFLSACKQTGGGEKPTPPPTAKHAITFSVDGGNGTLKAKVGEGTGEKEINSGRTLKKARS